MEYSQKDIAALNEKLNDPNKTVKCPRCGKNILVDRFGNSYHVYCESRNCIENKIRGI